MGNRRALRLRSGLRYDEHAPRWAKGLVRYSWKYGRVFEKKDNVPIILLGNSLPYSYNIESFRSRVFEMHFFSKCDRLASTLFILCVRYYITVLPDGDGINHLGKLLVSEAEKEELRARIHRTSVLNPIRDAYT